MFSEQFQYPQRQSLIGILLIFFKVVYNFLRGSWIILTLIIISSSDQIKFYSLLGIPILGGLGIIYSYFYYRNFLFHIDYDKQKFVLEKGVFTSNSIRIPFDRIQQVDLKRSLLQRILGVYGLTVDTAGSKAEEIHIHALTEKDAKNMSDILTKVKTESQSPSQDSLELEEKVEEEKTTTKDLWNYHTSLLTLFKVGLTRSYLRGFLLITVFLSSIFNQIQQSFKSHLDEAFEYSESFINKFSDNFIIIPALIIFAVILSIVVTVGEVIIKHFNLRLQQTPNHLEIEMGLKTNTRVSFQARRLQVLKILTNPIQKRLHLYEAHFSLASSQDELGKNKIITPGLNPETLERIKSFLYTEKHSDISKKINPHIAWVNRRYIFLGIGLMAVWIYSYFRYNLENILSLLFIFSLFLLVLLPYQYFLYKTIQLELDDEFLIVKEGLWTQKTEIIELYKMEGVSLKQPFWYKRRKLYNLTFHTAGGDLKIRAVPDEILKDINFILYKIESSAEAWM